MRVKMRIAGGAAIAAIALGMGCSSKAQVDARTTTVGQELTDLEKARDAGVITEKEYQEQRTAILERNKK